MAHWQYTLDISDCGASDPECSDWEEARDKVVARMKEHELYGQSDEFYYLASDLSLTENVEELDAALARLCNYADRGHKLWIKTSSLDEDPSSIEENSV
jgi:hypothetical protein